MKKIFKKVLINEKIQKRLFEKERKEDKEYLKNVEWSCR
jgi:hypothetical protein